MKEKTIQALSWVADRFGDFTWWLTDWALRSMVLMFVLLFPMEASDHEWVEIIFWVSVAIFFAVLVVLLASYLLASIFYALISLFCSQETWNRIFK